MFGPVISFVEKTYYNRLTQLRAITGGADDKIRKLQETRNLLVQKNLSGIYSDEVFREQNAIIEDNMTKAQIVKEDSRLDKYNIVEITTFIRRCLQTWGNIQTI